MLLKSIFILYATVLILFLKKPTPNSIFIIGIAVNRKRISWSLPGYYKKKLLQEDLI